MKRRPVTRRGQASTKRRSAARYGKHAEPRTFPATWLLTEVAPDKDASHGGLLDYGMGLSLVALRGTPDQIEADMRRVCLAMIEGYSVAIVVLG